MDRARQTDADDEPDEPGSVAELCRQDRTDEGTGPGDGREVMPEEDEPVSRVIVVAVVPLVRRRDAAVVERHDSRRNERAVIAVRDRQDAENRKDEVKGAHLGSLPKLQGTSIAGWPHGTYEVPFLCSLRALSFPSRFPRRRSHSRAGISARTRSSTGTFNFKVLKTDHFDIYYYQEEEQAARMASRMAERWYTRISTLLNHELRGRQPLILYASGPHFRQTNAIEGELGEGTGGVTEAYKRRIVLPFAGPIEATDHVLGHELVHAFQYDITNTNVSSGNAGALALPLWFIEGMAEYLSVGPVDPHTSMWMREAARREKLPNIDDLDNPKYFPYRYGQAVWAFIGGRYGDAVVGDMLRAGAGRDAGYKQAIESVLGTKTEELSKEWHCAVFEAYRPIAETTKTPGAIARAVIPRKKGNALNVSPELSPDGSKVIFFSERDLFSIDLFVADAQAPAKSSGKSPIPQPTPTSRACSSCLRPAHGITPANGSSSLASAKDSRCSQ